MFRNILKFAFYKLFVCFDNFACKKTTDRLGSVKQKKSYLQSESVVSCTTGVLYKFRFFKRENKNLWQVEIIFFYFIDTMFKAFLRDFGTTSQV